MKYVVYKDPWHGAMKYEVRTQPGERTMAHCSSREEAKRIAHALNTKPALVSPEEWVIDRERAQVIADRLNEAPARAKTGSVLDMAGTNVEKFLIHPDLARNAKVEWPDVDLDK